MRIKLKFYIIIFCLIGVGLIFKYCPYGKINYNAMDKRISVGKTQSISVSFVGDILLAGHVGEKINKDGVNYPFTKIRPILYSSDFSIGNLESAVGISGVANGNKQYAFRADPKVLKGVKWSGIDILSVANNHVLDYGPDAFKETLDGIRSEGMYYVGAGKDIDEAYSPAIVEKHGQKIAIFAVSRVVPSVDWHAGKNWRGVASIYNPDKLIDRMKSIRGQVDMIAVYLHWGVEKESMPKSYQRGLARQLIDSGADIVIGSHPHVLQGFEFYKGKLIAYSLGNFVFTNLNNETLILNVNYNQDGTQSVRIIPCLIKNYRPEMIETDKEKKEFYKMIEKRSFGVKVEEGKLMECN
jgi:poly-gamma-glutamate synthesis protein (capsule biosynthesis protein)